MMNKGWECPKCGAVFSPTYMECKYCKPKDELPKNAFPDATFPSICNHEWDTSQVYSFNPSRLKCKKCNLDAPFFRSGEQVFL